VFLFFNRWGNQRSRRQTTYPSLRAAQQDLAVYYHMQVRVSCWVPQTINATCWAQVHRCLDRTPAVVECQSLRLLCLVNDQHLLPSKSTKEIKRTGASGEQWAVGSERGDPLVHIDGDRLWNTGDWLHTDILQIDPTEQEIIVWVLAQRVKALVSEWGWRSSDGPPLQSRSTRTSIQAKMETPPGPPITLRWKIVINIEMLWFVWVDRR